MIIHRHGQLMATLRAAALEDDPTVSGGHASPKAVHAQSAMNFWLISPLRHYYTFLSVPELLSNLKKSRMVIIPHGHGFHKVVVSSVSPLRMVT